jgi:hypothetical protein
MPFPRKSADYVAHFRRFNEITGTTAIAVTTAVTDIDRLEKIARWLDYRFSKEGALLLNYGIEGETFEYVDGKPVFNDRILKDPNGIAPGDMMQQLLRTPHTACFMIGRATDRLLPMKSGRLMTFGQQRIGRLGHASGNTYHRRGNRVLGNLWRY